MLILKVTKNMVSPSFQKSTFLEKPQVGLKLTHPTPSCFQVNGCFQIVLVTVLTVTRLIILLLWFCGHLWGSFALKKFVWKIHYNLSFAKCNLYNLHYSHICNSWQVTIRSIVIYLLRELAVLFDVKWNYKSAKKLEGNFYTCKYFCRSILSFEKLFSHLFIYYTAELSF